MEVVAYDRFCTWRFDCIIWALKLPLEPCANSKQNRFPLDFLHTFTVILPSVTPTLDNLPKPPADSK